MHSPLAAAVNTLTARWLAAAGPRAAAVSGLGVWPLLALIAEPCEGRGRAELAAAIGIPPQDAVAQARAVLGLVNESPAAAMAAGLWTREDLELDPEWAKRLPAGTRGIITGSPDVDAPALDAWASDHTGGRIPAFPLATNQDTRLVLATALAVETTWERPFSGDAALHRTSHELEQVRVAATPHGPFTDLTVVGDRGVDVHLVLGPEDAAPDDVLSAGVEAVAASSATPGDTFTAENPYPGPGLTVERTTAYRPVDELSVSTVAFDLAATHDLLEYADVFGLRSVSDLTRGHFPGMSKEPLGVGAAAQNIVARFSATGFEAAAVTAFGVYAGSAAPLRTHEVTRVSVVFDRPFAYYAVDRASGLILVAGWVAEAGVSGPVR